MKSLLTMTMKAGVLKLCGLGELLLCCSALSGCSLVASMGIQIGGELAKESTGIRSIDGASHAIFPLPPFVEQPLPSNEQMRPEETIVVPTTSPFFKSVEFVPENYSGELEKRYAKALNEALISSNIKAEARANYVLHIANLTTVVPNSKEDVRLGLDYTYISADVSVTNKETGQVLFSEWVRLQVSQRSTGDSSAYGWIPLAVAKMVREHIARTVSHIADSTAG